MGIILVVVRGFLRPDVSGEYRFFVAGDDETQLFLSTDDNPANASLIANVPTNTGFQEWDRFDEQESDVIDLIAGELYYIEVLHKDGTGGDHFSVGWQLPDGTLERPILGDALLPFFEGLIIEDWAWDFDDNSPIATERMPTHIFNSSGSFNVGISASTSACTVVDTIVFQVAEPTGTNIVFPAVSYTHLTLPTKRIV